MITWEITTWVPRTRYHATFVGRDETGQWWRRPLLCDPRRPNVRLDAAPVAHTVLEPEAVDCRGCRRALEDVGHWLRVVGEVGEFNGICNGCGRHRWTLQPRGVPTGPDWQGCRWVCLPCREGEVAG